VTMLAASEFCYSIEHLGESRPRNARPSLSGLSPRAARA
jgi:hypothetical protein